MEKQSVKAKLSKLALLRLLMQAKKATFGQTHLSGKIENQIVWEYSKKAKFIALNDVQRKHLSKWFVLCFVFGV